MALPFALVHHILYVGNHTKCFTLLPRTPTTNSEKQGLEKANNHIDNQEFTSLPDPSGQTEKQDDVLEVEEVVGEV